jgi:hypothetical protein
MKTEIDRPQKPLTTSPRLGQRKFPRMGIDVTSTVAAISAGKGFLSVRSDGSEKWMKGNLPSKEAQKMTAVKNHSMALKDGEGTKIEVETLNPACSTSGWVCRLALSLNGGRLLAVYLTSEEAKKLGVVLFRAVAQI